jgi:hypothetical protein
MRQAATFVTVRQIGAVFPGVEESTSYGAPSLKVGGQMFACMASHKSAEPGTLVVRLDFEQRDELIAAEPDVYYLQPHYVDYPCVLVRLSRIRRDALADLLRTGWKFVSMRTRRKKSAVGPRRRLRRARQGPGD